MRTTCRICTSAIALAIAGGGVAHAHTGDGATASTLGKPRAALAVQDASPQAIGRFTSPFSEPTVGGQTTEAACITDKNGVRVCKPAAGSLSVLPRGDVFYWNALEGTENVDANIVAEFGRTAVNDQTRRLNLATREWSAPEPVDGGATIPQRNPVVPGSEGEDDQGLGALFCSDFNLLPDGRILAVGGTAYYQDPSVPGTDYGVVELEGLPNARIYDPKTNEWSQTGGMETGRWYPTLVSLADGRQFVASGVRKLLKPVYTDRPAESGANVRQTETYDPTTGNWVNNGAAAARTLPLYPRLHLLPNGRVFYNAGGQAFNPFGQSYDEALWNEAAVYDPASRSWRGLGIPGLETAPDPQEEYGNVLGDLANAGFPGGGKAATIPGFRGSTFSVQLPLQPDDQGRYVKAEFLTAGGVLNPPSPGSHFTTSDSRITTVDSSGETETMSTRATGDLNRSRWYPSGILLPTGEVVAFSGSDRDHVQAPGVEFPVKQAELFDPVTETWRPIATGFQPRTYHNSAVLLPDGDVLVGGHAPITTLYLRHLTLPGGTAPNDGRDPSFEVFHPPYQFRGAKPRVKRVSAKRPRSGSTLTIRMGSSPKNVERVVLVRDATATHVIDADQRAVVLPVVGRTRKTVTVEVPGATVAPPGPYHLFVNRKSKQGPIPSRGVPVTIR